MKDIQRIYSIEEIRSQVELIMNDSLDKFLYQLHGSYKVICWQHQGVYRGTFEDYKMDWAIKKGVHKAGPSMEIKYWQRARIFNEAEEYFITIRDGKVFGRHRKDGEGEDIKCIQSHAVLRSIVVGANLEHSDSKRECIRLINYLGFDDIGKVKVVDMRFVNFKMMKYGIFNKI